MQRRDAKSLRNGTVLAAVAAFHLCLLYLILHLQTIAPPTRNFESLIRILKPEPVKRTPGAPLKAPVVTQSVFDLPKIAPPKIVIQIIRPNPQAPPAPAPAAAQPAASSPVAGNKPTPIPLPPDDFTAYRRLLHNRLQQTLDGIIANRLSQRPGTVAVVFEVDRTGKLLAWKIADEHVPPVLRYEITQLMQLSNPMPPFPAKIRAATYLTWVQVTFDERAPPGMGGGF